MGEHETHGIIENIFDGLLGKDIYFWNFIVLMVFTLFEVAAVFFSGIPSESSMGHPHRCWNRQRIRDLSLFHALEG